jgi:hypothetical protein
LALPKRRKKYEFFDADPEPLKTLKNQNLPQHIRGLQLYRAGDWQQALSLFEACLKICPEDPIARLYVERCKAHLASPPGVDWNGVTVLREK